MSVAPEIYSFRLFVTGDSLSSQRAIANLRGLCAAALGEGFEMDVIDVLQRPELAEQERVIATPTVLRLSPPPPRRAIGDLSDFDLAAVALGLAHPQASTTGGRS